MSPTITSPALVSGVGVLLGTAAYMSPEQAKGRPADKRSDIWAFGCVLYEIVTGKRAFAGDDVPDTLVAVLRDDPTGPRCRHTRPSAFVRRCECASSANPKQRAQAIADVRLALAGAFDLPVRQTPPDLVPRLRFGVVIAAAVMIGVAGGAVAVTWLVMRPSAPRVIRGTIIADGSASLSINGNSRDLAVTRDGSHLVYRGNGQILVRALDQLEPTRLAGTGNSTSLFVSPDGQWVDSLTVRLSRRSLSQVVRQLR
jgi:serine/threonine-protein kinase